MPETMDRTEIGTLRDVILRLNRRLRRHSHSKLTLSQMSALSALDRHGSMRVGDLARREQIGKSSVTRLVAHLEASGHIDRQIDPTDRRSFRVELSRQGRDLLVDANEKASAFLTSQVEALPESDREILRLALPVLSRLVAARP